MIRAPTRRRRSSSLRALVTISALASLPSCGGGGGSLPTNTPLLSPQDCAALSTGSWTVGLAGSELDLAVGESKREGLYPLVYSECSGVLVSVTWAVDERSIASVQPWNGTKDTVWVTGVAPGQTAVRAHVVFSDGRTRDALPEPVRVTPPITPPGSTLVTEGDVALPAPPSDPGASHQYVPFSLRASGQVDILVDWDSLLDSVDFSVYQSPCSIESCGSLVLVTRVSNVKPLPASGSFAAGDYTIRIDNMGPGAEHVHYEVRLTPR